jgi:hypothetical protein
MICITDFDRVNDTFVLLPEASAYIDKTETVWLIKSLSLGPRLGLTARLTDGLAVGSNVNLIMNVVFQFEQNNWHR